MCCKMVGPDMIRLGPFHQEFQTTWNLQRRTTFAESFYSTSFFIGSILNPCRTLSYSFAQQSYSSEMWMSIGFNFDVQGFWQESNEARHEQPGLWTFQRILYSCGTLSGKPQASESWRGCTQWKKQAKQTC